MKHQALVSVLFACLSMAFASASCLNSYGINEMGILEIDAAPRKFIASNGGTFIWGVDLKANQYYELIVKEKDGTHTTGHLFIGLVEEKCKNCILANAGEITNQGLRLYFVQDTSGGNQVQGTFKWTDETVQKTEFSIEIRSIFP